ncbi:hypothetical protein ZWY2020_025154 [Hordeum vulgare]|nr:hypothetical protein ZWY2020_025154 [Hordeum vulgare]
MASLCHSCRSCPRPIPIAPTERWRLPLPAPVATGPAQFPSSGHHQWHRPIPVSPTDSSRLSPLAPVTVGHASFPGQGSTSPVGPGPGPLPRRSGTCPPLRLLVSAPSHDAASPHPPPPALAPAPFPTGRGHGHHPARWCRPHPVVLHNLSRPHWPLHHPQPLPHPSTLHKRARSDAVRWRAPTRQ